MYCKEDVVNYFSFIPAQLLYLFSQHFLQFTGKKWYVCLYASLSLLLSVDPLIGLVF